MEINAEITQAIVVPAIIGLIEVVKRFEPPDRALPVFALILGIIGAFVFPEPEPALTVLKGLVFGLMASGLWSQARTIARG